MVITSQFLNTWYKSIFLIDLHKSKTTVVTSDQSEQIQKHNEPITAGSKKKMQLVQPRENQIRTCSPDWLKTV